MCSLDGRKGASPAARPRLEYGKERLDARSEAETGRSLIEMEREEKKAQWS
jgi:hypothetical protein